MKKAQNVLGTGLWIASAIQVAGFTWKAYTGEYQQFPSTDGSGGTGGGSNLNNPNTTVGAINTLVNPTVPVNPGKDSKAVQQIIPGLRTVAKWNHSIKVFIEGLLP